MTRGPLEFGPYRLESGPDRLWRGTEEIALRPKSLKVLAYLARRPGRLVSKEELREQVWGATHVSDTRLRVAVREVRAALGDGQDSPEYIETVPARGYRFLATEEPSALDDEARSTPEVPWRDGPDPIVGREREVEHLVNRFLEASRGERRLVFLGGEPGVGKTTVVNLFLEHLAGRPQTTCARGQCVMHYGSGEAYAPVLEALGRLGHEDSGRAMIRVLERCAPMWLVQLPALVESEELERLQRQVQGATRERMVRELSDALERLTAEETLVLVLEDLHWSDVATLDLLAAIAHRPEPARLLIVGTYRPAEAVVRAPALREMMSELEGKGLCERADLELLTPGDVAAYVSTRIDGASSEDIATVVYERSEGNALFMVTLLEHLMEARALRRRDGRWVLDRASAALTQIPRGLRPFIQRRLDALSVEERELLEVASVVGVEFAAAAVIAELLHSGDEHDPERIETRLESLLSRTHLIDRCGTTEWPDGTLTARYRFGHALYREALYEQIPEVQRARLHRHAARRLQEAYGRDSLEIAAALAVHFEEGRDPENAARYRRMAGERALGRHAHHEAIVHLRGALDALEKLSSRPVTDTEYWVRLELDVCTALGASLVATRGYGDPEADRLYVRAEALSRERNDPIKTLQTLFRTYTFDWMTNSLQNSASAVERMAEIAAETDHVEAELLTEGARGMSAFFRGEGSVSDEAHAQVLALYDPKLHDEASLHYPGVSCRGLTAMGRWLAGSPDEAVDWTRRGLTFAEGVGTPYGIALALGFAVFVHQFRRDLDALSRNTDDLEALAQEQGFQLWVAWARIFRGWLAAARGDGADGIALMERGLDELSTTGQQIALPYFLGILAETQLALGRGDAAQQRVIEARALAERRDERWWEAEIHRLEGEAVLAAGETPLEERRAAAEACFRRALEVAGRQGATSLELRAALSLSRLGNSHDAHQLLSEVVGGFTEGHDTADLRAAQTQLSQIDPPTDD